MLKILGTVETTFDNEQWRAALQKRGWSARLHGERIFATKGSLQIEVESQRLALVHGWMGSMHAELEAIESLLRDAGQILQLDIFEEDGRMIKRITG